MINDASSKRFSYAFDISIISSSWVGEAISNRQIYNHILMRFRLNDNAINDIAIVRKGERERGNAVECKRKRHRLYTAHSTFASSSERKIEKKSVLNVLSLFISKFKFLSLSLTLVFFVSLRSEIPCSLNRFMKMRICGFFLQ